MGGLTAARVEGYYVLLPHSIQVSYFNFDVELSVAKEFSHSSSL